MVPVEVRVTDRPSTGDRVETYGPLARTLITLAGIPDDVPEVEVQLSALARLAADRVAAADYASVTALRDNAYSTVAASSELVVAVDEAQYAERDGPCLRAIDGNKPVTVPDIATTIRWPNFREAAIRMGLHSSVSVPVFTGSGVTIAALNLYGRDPAAMVPLISGVWALYDPDRPMPPDEDLQALDVGGQDLLAGFAEALAVRSTIQLAIGTIMGGNGIDARKAYLELRLHAADTGVSLLDAANSLIRRTL
jgi:GAF domain-containing protein